MKPKAILFDVFGVLNLEGKANPEIVEFIQANTNTYLFGVLSAAEGDLHPWLQEHGIADYFSLVQTTAKVGKSKSDPVFYHKALEILDLEPDQAVFVDDTEGYLEVAAKVGLKTLRYNPHQNFLGQIKPLL